MLEIDILRNYISKYLGVLRSGFWGIWRPKDYESMVKDSNAS